MGRGQNNGKPKSGNRFSELSVGKQLFIAGCFGIAAAVIGSLVSNLGQPNVNVTVNAPNVQPPAAAIPTALPFEPATPNQTLIILGSFDDQRANKTVNVDIMQRTYDQLVEISQRQNIPDVIVKQVLTPVIRTDDDARKLGKLFNAKLVIWGSADDANATIRAIQPNENKKPAGRDGIDLLQLNPTSVPVCLRDAVPPQGTYLAFSTLGEAVLDWTSRERVQLASGLFEAALSAAEGIRKECSSFNPWNGYGLQGHLYGTLALFFAQDNKTATAIEWRKKAIDAYDKSLSWRDDVSSGWVLGGKGFSQLALAELLAKDQPQQAIVQHKASIESYERAIQIKPDDVGAWHYKGVSQAALAELLAKDQPQEAIAQRKAAIESYERATQIKPDDAGAWHNKGYSQAVLADLLAKDQPQEAIAQLKASIESFDRAIQIKPDDALAWYNKGCSQAALADVLAKDQPQEAIVQRKAEIASYERAIQIKSDDADAWHNKGYSQAALADLLAKDQPQEAIVQRKAAIASYERAIEIKSDDADAWHNKGYSQAVLADLLAKDQPQEAIAQRKAAIESYKKVVELNQDPTWVNSAKENIERLSKL